MPRRIRSWCIVIEIHRHPRRFADVESIKTHLSLNNFKLRNWTDILYLHFTAKSPKLHLKLHFLKNNILITCKKLILHYFYFHFVCSVLALWHFWIQSKAVYLCSTCAVHVLAFHAVSAGIGSSILLTPIWISSKQSKPQNDQDDLLVNFIQLDNYN